MTLGELTLLSASSFVVYAACAIGWATLRGRAHRVPGWLRSAVLPNAATMGRKRRRAYLTITLSFMLISQGLLVFGLMGGEAPVGRVVVLAEYTAVIATSVYLLRGPPRSQ